MIVFSASKIAGAILRVINQTGYPVNVTAPHAQPLFIKPRSKPQDINSGFHKITEIQWNYSIPQERKGFLRTLSWSAKLDIGLASIFDELTLEPNGVAKLNDKIIKTYLENDHTIDANFD